MALKAIDESKAQIACLAAHCSLKSTPSWHGHPSKPYRCVLPLVTSHIANSRLPPRVRHGVERRLLMLLVVVQEAVVRRLKWRPQRSKLPFARACVSFRSRSLVNFPEKSSVHLTSSSLTTTLPRRSHVSANNGRVHQWSRCRYHRSTQSRVYTGYKRNVYTRFFCNPWPTIIWVSCRATIVQRAVVAGTGRIVVLLTTCLDDVHGPPPWHRHEHVIGYSHVTGRLWCGPHTQVAAAAAAAV